MNAIKNIAVFASGSGTNAENIAKTFAGGNRIRVVVALTDHQDAGVVERMKALGIPSLFFPGKTWRENPDAILEALKPYDIDLVVLAGFMRKVDDAIVNAFPDRMLNIHPSLLPAYGGKGMYGHHVHEAVIAAGEKQSGVTVHKVTSEIDGGEIVMQGILDLAPGETPESLEAKIHEIEYELYPRAIVKTFKDLDSKKNTNNETSSSETTPDEQWAQALHLPYTPDEELRKRVEIPPINEDESNPQIETKSEQTVQVRPPKLEESSPATEVKSHRHAVVPPPINPAPAVTLQATEATANGPAKSYLALSIIFLILFGIFPAIVALIYSIKTRNRNSVTDYIGAEKSSRTCQGWLIATFCVGVLLMSFTMPLMIAAFSVI